ncbi:uncharacterized protein LOC114289402 [Camellia sinensis]|uniref:uncharacterized protein LOC114289402 n=1 Tax=Camellia sinensis TaxID=4442 RepID=UPI001036AE21|nr:uncharacterized protein LOC114289402 [Camellia sinensis]
MRKVLSTQPTVKKGKWEAKNAITFSNKDLARLQNPHNGALVVALLVKNFDIKWILIDQGSSCEIMYYEAFKQLKVEDKDLASATSPLVGFNSLPEWPVGKIILPVKVGSMTKLVEFWVLKVPSIYNIILGGAWFHAMRAVASTYHQVMRFPNEARVIEEVMGDQIMFKQCFVTVNGSRTGKGFMQMIDELESNEMFTHVCKAAEQKAVEVRIKENNLEKFFLLGSSLSNIKRREIMEFFISNIEVFAWTPYAMPGIDLNFFCHQLNINPTASPIIQ